MKQNLIETVNEYLSLGINQQLDYEKFYLYSIITHSTAIEGSTVTEIENQLLFDEGISTNKPMAEQLMNLDLKKAYEQSFIYAKSHADFSIELLCSLAALVMQNTGSTYKTIGGDFSSAKGDLRLLNVSAGREAENPILLGRRFLTDCRNFVTGSMLNERLLIKTTFTNSTNSVLKLITTLFQFIRGQTVMVE